jgi:hypothetical protein
MGEQESEAGRLAASAGRPAIRCRPDGNPALGSGAALLLERAIQAFRELPESPRGLSKVLVFFFESVNRLDAVFQRITLVLVAHGPPFRSGRSMSKKEADYG